MTATSLDPLPGPLACAMCDRVRASLLVRRARARAAGGQRLRRRRRSLLVRRGSGALALVSARRRSWRRREDDARRDAQAALPRRRGVDAGVGHRLVRAAPRGRRLGHALGGGYYGFITNACFEAKEKVGAIALVNGIGNATELALELGTIARESVRDAAPAIEVPEPLPEAWRPLVGLYTAPHSARCCGSSGSTES